MRLAQILFLGCIFSSTNFSSYLNCVLRHFLHSNNSNLRKGTGENPSFLLASLGLCPKHKYLGTSRNEEPPPAVPEEASPPPTEAHAS
jgi:hypothetical protein